MTEERNQSEWNMMGSVLHKINAYFWKASMAIDELDAHNAFMSLRILDSDLDIYMNDKTRLENKNYIEKLHPAVASCSDASRKTGINKMDDNLFELIMDYYKFLRRVADKAGLLNKTIEDPSQALGGQ